VTDLFCICFQDCSCWSTVFLCRNSWWC